MQSKRQDKKTFFIHFIAYILLLIVTPFVLLKNYMQAAIGRLSEFSFHISNIEIPYVLAVFILIVVSILIIYRKQLNKIRILSLAGVFILVFIGQNSTDFYFDHKFYELQHNWHYLAYGIFSFFSIRWLRARKVSTSKTILFTFLFAMTISSIDEAVQVPLSSRIFDICDIGKDLWGTIVGMFFIFFVIEEGNIFKGKYKINAPKLKDYLISPFALLFNIAIFSEIFLLFSSVLSDVEYLNLGITVSVIIFLIVFLIIYLIQFKISRIIVISVISIFAITQIYSIFKNSNRYINHYQSGLVIYKGIPIPLFDIMIFNNGTFRLVDKKTSFNTRDRNTIYKYATDILIIGNADKERKIRGFANDNETQFVYNPKTGKALQVIILDIRHANKKFNELKAKNYNVVYIIHQK